MVKIYYLQGYGVPRDIFKDQNYTTYLGIVFNYIYSETRLRKVSPVIYLAGGLTDTFKPYRRTEAGEMRKLLARMTFRLELKKKIASWRYAELKDCYSTVEGLLALKNKIDQKISVVIFGEATRADRMGVLAQKIFGRRAKVVGVDFDLSARRYLNPKIIQKKEKQDLAQELRIVKNPKLLKAYRQEKLERLVKLRRLDLAGRRRFYVEEYKK
jgi:hypothetical protein